MVHFPFSYHLIILPTLNLWREALVAEIHAVADTTYLPTYTDPLQLAQAMHGLHMSEMLGYDDDGAEDEGVNDIDTTLMAPNVPNQDYTLEEHQLYRQSCTP